MISPLERYQGALLGLACGDAVGTRVEFKPRGSFPPVDDMLGGGPFDLQPGEWTDDTSMALCLGASLIHCRGFDAQDQMNRYCNWRSVGYMSSNGRCFDIGMTVAQALDEYLVSHTPFAGSTDPWSAGNGGLMRLAPIPMMYADSAEDTQFYAAESTRTTHGALEAVEASQLFALQIRAALSGADKSTVLAQSSLSLQSPKVAALASASYRDKSWLQLKGSGYCIESLEAALWCFANTESFEDAILAATNLGDDADTTAAICGQLAGAFYGLGGIPERWRARLVMADEMLEMAEALYRLSR